MSAEVAIEFDDGAAYQRFMGAWSQAAGAIFLDWIQPPRDACWLEIGCGTGAFTELVLRTCSPARIHAIDPAPELIGYAKRRLENPHVAFLMANANHLPFRARSFDLVASALVLNFVAERRLALEEMRRTARAGATIAAYVWDFAGRRAPNSCLALGLQSLGLEAPSMPGAASSSLAALVSDFEAAGLTPAAVTSYDVAMAFDGFDSFWIAQTPGFSPLAKAIAALTPDAQASLREFVRARTVRDDGSVSCSARANAIKARTP